MDTPANQVPPVAPSPIPPGTSLVEIAKYLLSSRQGGGIKIGLTSWRAIIVAVLAWFANDKRLEWRDGTSVPDLKRRHAQLAEWHNEVSNRLQRLEDYALAPPTQPTALDALRLRASQFPGIPGVTNSYPIQRVPSK